MWELGIPLDHLPSPIYEINKATYHYRPGFDLTAKMLFQLSPKVQNKGNGLLRKVSNSICELWALVGGPFEVYNLGYEFYNETTNCCENPGYGNHQWIKY